MKRSLVFVRRSLAAIVVLVASLFFFETYNFVTTDEVKAKAHAQKIFVEQCRRDKVGASDYDGPFLRKDNYWSYELRWTNRKNGHVALGVVQFFSLQTEIWILNHKS